MVFVWWFCMKAPGGPVLRQARATSREGAIRLDTGWARDWWALLPRPGRPHWGGAPPERLCAMPAWQTTAKNNHGNRTRNRGRKVPEEPRLCVPASRWWHTVMRESARAMVNLWPRRGVTPCRADRCHCGNGTGGGEWHTLGMLML